MAFHATMNRTTTILIMLTHTHTHILSNSLPLSHFLAHTHIDTQIDCYCCIANPNKNANNNFIHIVFFEHARDKFLLKVICCHLYINIDIFLLHLFKNKWNHIGTEWIMRKTKTTKNGGEGGGREKRVCILWVREIWKRWNVIPIIEIWSICLDICWYASLQFIHTIRRSRNP